MFVRIRADNGFEECLSCAHCETSVCLVCDEASKYEPDHESYLAFSLLKEKVA